MSQISPTAQTAETAQTDAAPASAGPARPGRHTTPLPLLVEVRRQAGRRRTLVVFGLVLGLPLLVVGAFALGSDDGDGGASLVDLATSSGVNFALFILLASSGFLLAVAVALFAGDCIASEATWGSLRYLLAAPVPRRRLLGVKLTVGLFSGLLAVVGIVASALAFGTLFYGGGALTTILGTTLPVGDGILRLGGSTLYVFVSLLWVAAVAFLLGTLTDAALGAVGGAVLLLILSNILDSITALGDLRVWLPTHDAGAWLDLFSPVVDWSDVIRGAAVSLSWSVVALAGAWWRFSRKDVVS